MLHDAYRLAAALGGHFGQSDVAVMASERHVALASRTGEPLRVAISAYHRSTYFLQRGHFARGIRVLERAHESVQQSGVPARHPIAVQLNLRTAVLAVRSGDGARADQHAAEARALSEEHAPPASPYHNIDASNLNIDVHWCAAPVEYYDGTTSVARAARISIVDRQRPNASDTTTSTWLAHGCCTATART